MSACRRDAWRSVSSELRTESSRGFEGAPLHTPTHAATTRAPAGGCVRCTVQRYGKLRKKLGKRPLLFVRRGSILVQRGNAFPRIPAALLGRFLPRLGPPASLGGLFFCRLRGISPGKRRCCRNVTSTQRGVSCRSHVRSGLLQCK